MNQKRQMKQIADRVSAKGHLISGAIMFGFATWLVSQTTGPIMLGLITNSEKVQHAHLTADASGDTWGMRMLLLAIFAFCTLVIYASIPFGMVVGDKLGRLWDKV